MTSRVEVSGSIPLTQRLVEAADKIAFDEFGKWRALECEYIGRMAPVDPPSSDVGKVIVSALLRELVVELDRQNWERRATWLPRRAVDGVELVAANMELARVQDVLLALAESVERGEA